MFRILSRINVRVLFVLLLIGVGGIFYTGASTSPVIVFVLAVCIISFFWSMYLAKWVLSKDEGPPEMTQVLDHFGSDLQFGCKIFLRIIGNDY